MDTSESDYERWQARPPDDLFGDPIWRLPAYRLSRFLALVVRKDIKRLRLAHRRSYVPEQLKRAVDSVSTNITEGYSRLSGRERARFYEYALGSAREARDWYARLPSVGAEVALGRARLLTRIIKILNVAIPEERSGSSERRIRRAIDERLRSRNEEDKGRILPKKKREG
jgi:four helix bundle protein